MTKDPLPAANHPRGLSPVSSIVVRDMPGRRLLQGRNLRLALMMYVFLQVAASIGSWNLSVRSGGLQSAWIGIPPVCELHYRYLVGEFELGFFPVMVVYGIVHHAGFVIAVLRLREGRPRREPRQLLIGFFLWLYYGVSLLLAGMLAVGGVLRLWGMP